MWFFVAAALVAAPPSGPSREPWAIVLKAPANHSERVTLEFGTLGVASRRPERLAYYARRTVTRFAADITEIRWADSLSCPTLTTVLADLRHVPMPRIDVPGFPSQPGGTDESIAIDGVTYRLELFGTFRFETNVGSALSRWTDGALQRLEPCWRAEAPRDVG